MVFNPQDHWTVNANDLRSKAGWSPYEGWRLRGKLRLEEAVRLFSSGPASAFTMQTKGRIAPGYDADLIVFNPQDHWTVALSDLRSKAGWSPYEGWRLRGKIMGVFLRGEQAMWEGELQLKAGAGKPLQRALMIGTERLDLRKHAKERYSL